MDIQVLFQELKNSQEKFDHVKKIESDIIKQEVDSLMKLAGHMKEVATKKVINGEECMLIYVYGQKDKSTSFISPEAYLTPKGEVVYQVFRSSEYLGYRPEAKIEKGFVYVPIEEFMEHLTYQDVVEFFIGRIDVLKEEADEITNKNQERIEFVKKMNRLLK